MADDAPAQAEANLAARAAALKARKPGRPDIDVVVQLEWVNPKTTKQHLILQNSCVVSKTKHQKMLRMLTQPPDRGGRVGERCETAPKLRKQ